MITINLDKAKVVVQNKFRDQRKPLLAALDIEVMKNIANPEVVAEIEAKKQILRDAPALVETMTTLEELKAATLPTLE